MIAVWVSFYRNKTMKKFKFFRENLYQQLKTLPAVIGNFLSLFFLKTENNYLL